ncbi:MAG: amidase family protein [Beijerinckiaceae bacterium]
MAVGAPIDPLLLSVTEQITLLQTKALSAKELLDLTLARIDKLNPALNAIVFRDDAKATSAANMADERLKSGTARPLEGLPITIKDAMDVEGFPSTGGSPGLKDRVPTVDAVAVARLRQAGAILIGRTNVPVFSGDFQSVNPMHGFTSNPWNPTFSSGGSSGGAAVAVATGMSSFEIGSDQGSSVRWPTATNGIHGLKSSWGLVSNWGIIPPPPEKRTDRNVELVAIGPMTRHAADLDLLLPILSGPRNIGIAGPTLAAPRHLTPKGLRVAVWLDEAFAPVDSAVSDGVRHAAKLLADQGAIVDERARPAFRFEEAYEVFALLNHWIVGYGLPPRLRDKIAGQASLVSPNDLSHRALQARGIRMTPGFYQEVNARRQRLIRQWAAFFTRYDVVLCPPAPVAALPHDHEPNIMIRTLDVNGEKIPYLNFLHWASLATGSNLPATVSPAGMTPDGMPRGVQIIGPMMEDRTPIAVSMMLEKLQGGYHAPPM